MFVLNLSDSSCRADVKNFILGFDISVEKKKKDVFRCLKDETKKREEKKRIKMMVLQKKIVYLHNYYQKIR